MIVRTAMEVNTGNRKEYVDSKAYTIIRHEGYLQGKAEAIDECLQILHNAFIHNDYCVNDCDDSGCDGCLYTCVKARLNKLKEKNNDIFL